MKTLRKNPHIYEINLMTWLNHLSQKYGKLITLRNIPGREWGELKEKGIDLIWLMGMWQRSPDSIQKAGRLPELIEESQAILSDFHMDDFAGSPYAVHQYVPDPAFGPVHDLHLLKQTIEDQGMRLILDFVPNHTACDHPWVGQHPEFYINRDPGVDGLCSEGFFPARGTQRKVCIAHGKDPYFPPWTDTAQLDYSNPAAVKAIRHTAFNLSAYCHGFRCDMAMLALNSIFCSTWTDYLATDMGKDEFWPLAIEGVRAFGAPCLWIAEVYWNRGKDLLDLGFDYAYDKRLLDLLIKEDIQGLKAHLAAPVSHQEKLVRFIENHDEPRANHAFGREKILAATIIHSTLPGMRFWQHGQFEGFRIRVPIQLRRAPAEAPQQMVVSFFEKLLKEVNHPVFHEGTWQLCESYGWPDNQSHQRLLSWCWRLNENKRLIAVNFTPSEVQGYLRLPARWLPENGQFICLDPFTGESYVRNTEEVKTLGLYVMLPGWGFHFFTIESA